MEAQSRLGDSYRVCETNQTPCRSPACLRLHETMNDGDWTSATPAHSARSHGLHASGTCMRTRNAAEIAIGRMLQARTSCHLRAWKWSRRHRGAAQTHEAGAQSARHSTCMGQRFFDTDSASCWNGLLGQGSAQHRLIQCDDGNRSDWLPLCQRCPVRAKTSNPRFLRPNRCAARSDCGTTWLLSAWPYAHMRPGSRRALLCWAARLCSARRRCLLKARPVKRRPRSLRPSPIILCQKQARQPFSLCIPACAFPCGCCHFLLPGSLRVRPTKQVLHSVSDTLRRLPAQAA